ncbi:hypothetical protein BFJ70_g2488 [Fusarium oxysporum]|nr:hypothetical protein BFJ70_g2488 [Fusarium oxysporum]
MEAQAETLQVLDLTQLDLALGFLPDRESAGILRRQFVDACQTVERADGRVRTLNAEAVAILNDLKAKQEKFETEKMSEREAIKKEKATLRQEQEKLKEEQLQFKNLAKSLGSRVQVLSENVVQVSENVNSWRSTVTDATNKGEEACRQLNQDIVTKLNDLSVSVNQNTKDLSSTKDKSIEMATAVASVREDQKQIEASLKDGVTMDGIKDQIKPLVSIATTINEVVQGLPTVASLDEKFANVGRLTERAEYFEAEAMRLDRDVQTLREEAQRLEDATAHQVAQANSRVEHANSLKGVVESRLQEKDSLISELREANADLQNCLTQAGSQGVAAQRRLDVVEQRLQTAEANSQGLAEVKNKLQRTEQAEMEARQRMADLQRALEREKKHHDACSAELTKTLSDKRDAIHQKSKLEDECSSVRDELKELRSQGSMDLQRQMKDQWATLKEVLEKQLSDKRSHDDTIRELHTACDSERQALQGRIIDKDSLIGRQNEELETLRSRDSTLELLQQELDMANKSIETVTKALEQAASDLQASEQRVVESRGMVLASEKELTETKAENESLREDWETAWDQVKNSNGVIERLEREHTVTKDMLSTLQAQSVTIPQGVTGELSRMYFRLADELRGIPTVPEINGELDMSEIAIEIGPLLIRYGKSDLLRFLRGGSEALHCSRQVIQGHRHSISSDGTCSYHDRCLLVRVVVQDFPALEFLRAE